MTMLPVGLTISGFRSGYSNEIWPAGGVRYPPWAGLINSVRQRIFLMTFLHMKYELIICRKRLDANREHLEFFVDDFKAQKVSDHVWEFETKHPFEGICHSADQYLNKDYRYVIIGFDGTEDDPIPNVIEHNDPTIRYYLSALQGKGAKGRYAIRIGSELHFARREHLLENPKDDESR
ncbi:MAG: hypothetical protein EOP84_06770 [Verrucomicrobiaceae bacterium]|nr:MAG: hypothetical protein EOP84_06770 [Verrucomicrobiaceae bacterium]